MHDLDRRAKTYPPEALREPAEQLESLLGTCLTDDLAGQELELVDEFFARSTIVVVAADRTRRPKKLTAVAQLDGSPGYRLAGVVAPFAERRIGVDHHPSREALDAVIFERIRVEGRDVGFPAHESCGDGVRNVELC